MRIVRAAALVVIGAYAGMAAAAAFVRRVVPSRGDETSDEVALVAIFGGVDLKSRAQAFRGGSLFAWYGGIELDLSEATLAADVHLTIHTLFGGVAVRLPRGCEIESNLHALGGGVAVSKPTPGLEITSTVALDGLAALGGIAVGAKPQDD